MLASAQEERQALAAAKAAADERAAELQRQLAEAVADLAATKVLNLPAAGAGCFASGCRLSLDICRACSAFSSKYINSWAPVPDVPLCPHAPLPLQAQGTPGGAAAKQVARLSMFKLRDLQEQLAAAEERAVAADQKSSTLSEQLAAAQEKLAAAHSEAAERAQEAASLSASLAQLEQRVAAEEEGRLAAAGQVTVSTGSARRAARCAGRAIMGARLAACFHMC